MKPRLRRLYDLQLALCAYCRRKMEKPSLLPPIRTPLTATIDHRQPISRGGTDHYRNLVACCAECNGLKADMSWDEWVAFMRANPLWYYKPQLDMHRAPLDQTPSIVEHSKQQFTAGETAQWLRDQGALQHLDWPWLIALTQTRVRQVGWGPW